MTASDAVRTVVYVTHPEGQTLTALRQARVSRDMLQRRLIPIALLPLGLTVALQVEKGPAPGWHGTALAESLALGFFYAGVLTATVTGWRAVSNRACLPSLGAVLVGSAVMAWLRPTGPGVIGMLLVVVLATRVLSDLARILLYISCVGYVVIGEAFDTRIHHQMGAVVLASAAMLAVVGLVMWVGGRSRQQEDQIERLLVDLEHSRGAELRAAALAERQRLARDMHDVLAHSLSGLTLQLEGARLLALSNPDDERLASTINRAHQLAKNGLDEARRAIGVLRDDELPAPEQMAAQARSFQADTGVPCQVMTSGTARDLGSAVRLALYRVTQEALTNVRKHARAQRVELRLDYEPAAVSLAVEDCADLGESDPAKTHHAYGGTPRLPVPPSGYGLTGMRERAELLGGTLTAAPTHTGFLVFLRVPT
jgi:signal transduction histidine kinase